MKSEGETQELGPSKRGKNKIKEHPGEKRAGYGEESRDSLMR